MQFGHIELFVSDPRASKEFYENALGFEVEAVQGEHYIWMKNGGKSILLRPGSPSGATDTYQTARSGFVLYTDDLRKSREELSSRGVVFLGTDGSESCLTFTDPDGNWFQLVNPNDH